MAVELRLPDVGEGALDVTINRWRVREGDEVKAGDVVLEVATDKVDTEVTAPASGKVLKINFSEGELAPVDAVLAVIGAEGDAVAPAVPSPAAPQPAAANGQDVKASPVARRVAADRGVALDNVVGTGPGGRITKGDVLSTPGGAQPVAVGEQMALPGDLANVASLTVRRLAAVHNMDLAEIAGGRPLSALTKYDLLDAIASRRAGEPVTVSPRFLPPAVGEVADEGLAPAERAATPSHRPAAAQPAGRPAPAPAQLGPGEELVKHTRMRQAIARNTVQSLFSAPHVTTLWDVNVSTMLAHRKAQRKEFADAGVNLTLTAYFVKAVVDALRAVPAANASWTDEGVIIKRTYNIGMAVALPQDTYGLGGLIVPVIKNAGDLNLMGLARAVNDLAEKARSNLLRPDDLQDGTFTVSNYGTSGSRFQTPVIVQPQVGILGIGAVEKRAVVVSQGHPLEANTGDYLAFLPMTTLGFSYDHRVLDGATADAFCAAVKQSLEGW